MCIENLADGLLGQIFFDRVLAVGAEFLPEKNNKMFVVFGRLKVVL